MRILQVVSYYAPAWAYGGPPRVMADFATGLVARGHEVTVLTTDVLDESSRARPARETLDGVRVERFRNVSNALAWRNKKYIAPALVAATARRIGEFDVVHATDARTLATATAYLAARAASVPFVLSAHGSLPGSVGLRGAVKQAYDGVLVRPMLERAALLLAQTDHEARLYSEAGGRESNIRLLPLPFDLAAVPAALEPGFLRARAGVGADAPLVLFLGRIHWLKGLDLLAEAVADEAELVVVGRDDGAWADIHARWPRTRFVGPLYGAERFAAYADADVFAITPRHWEETSVASLEAAACGTAVLVTEQAEIPGLAAAGGGLVVAADVGAIRDGLRRVLARSREMGVDARKLVERQHGRDAVVDRLEALLLDAVAAS
ncbi:MAG TPA: glycosyltransferase [Gaiellaceae bacterium]|nr:glycosyltransferase [Gaiellaceae bacterium]